jgi:hypothetical protein
MTDEQKRVRALIDEALADGYTYGEVLAVLTPEEFAIERSRTDAELARLEAERAEAVAGKDEAVAKLESIPINPLANWDHTSAPRN